MNAAALAEAVRRLTSNASLELSLRLEARRTYEALYRPNANLRLLLDIFEQALQVGAAAETAV